MKMIKKIMNKIVQIIVPVMLFANILNAQTPEVNNTSGVNGTVIDSVKGDPIIGVNVMIKEHKIFAVTDINGAYSLQNVPAGRVRIEFVISGYEISAKEITVVPGKINAVNISMSFRTAEEVLVSAKRVGNTDASLLTRRKKAAVVQDAISAEQISKTPDSDAGDVAKRVTGVAIIDSTSGKTIVIRGLGERYSGVMLGATPIPSSDPDTKIISLDIFPAAMLDNLIIMKAWIPEMPGEFAGGILQVNPKDFPDNVSMNVSIGTGFHSNTTGKDFLTYKGGKYDFLGYDDGTRDLPGGITGDRFNDDYYTPEETETIGESLENVYTPEHKKAILPLSVNFTYGDSYMLGEKKIGFIFSGMFKESSKNKNTETVSINDNWLKARDYDIKKSTYSTSDGVLLSAGLTGRENRFRLSSFYSHESKDNTSLYNGFDSQNDLEGNIKIYKILFIETSFIFNQLVGEHYLKNIFKSTANWTAAYSRAKRKEPDYRTVQLVDTEGDGQYYLYKSDDIKRRFLDYNEDVYDLSPSLSIPFNQWTGLQSKIKIGAAATYRERKSEQRTFSWFNDGMNNADSASEPIENLFEDEYIVGDYYSSDQTHYYLEEVSTQNNTYKGRMIIYAGYTQLDIPLFKELRMVGGVRYEYSKMDLISYNPESTKIEGLKNQPLKRDNILPGVSFTNSITENINLRLSYSRTLVRPDFLEVTEFQRDTAVPGRTIKGNEGLRQTDVHNGDLRFEWFPSVSEIIALSFFYKHMIKPIELLEVRGAGTIYMPNNSVSADNLGIEFEIKKNFGFLYMKDLSFSTNIAFIDSRIKVKDTSTANYTNNKRPLQGQSPYVINAGLNYDNSTTGTNCAVLYNIYGRRIVIVGTTSYDGKYRDEDVYEEATAKLDATIKQRIFGNSSLKFTASNLLDPLRKETRVIHKETGEKKKFTLESYRDGRNFSISYSYSL